MANVHYFIKVLHAEVDGFVLLLDSALQEGGIVEAVNPVFEFLLCWKCGRMERMEVLRCLLGTSGRQFTIILHALQLLPSSFSY